MPGSTNASQDFRPEPLVSGAHVRPFGWMEREREAECRRPSVGAPDLPVFAIKANSRLGAIFERACNFMTQNGAPDPVLETTRGFECMVAAALAAGLTLAVVCRQIPGAD